MSSILVNASVIALIVASLHLLPIYFTLRKEYWTTRSPTNGAEVLKLLMGGLRLQIMWQYTWTLVLLVGCLLA